MGGQENPGSIRTAAAALERDLLLLSRRGGPTHRGAFEQATALKQAMEVADVPPTLDQFHQALDRATLRLDDEEQQVVARAAFRRRPYNQPLLMDRLNTAAETLAASRSETRSSVIHVVSLPAPSHKTMDRYRQAAIQQLTPLLLAEFRQPAATSTPHQPIRYPLQGDYSDFVRDVTIPDGSLVQPGQTLHKQWELRNAGSVSWTNRRLTRIGATGGYASPKSPDSVPIPDTAPGETVVISVNVVAPERPAHHIAHWKMTDEHGQWCFPDRYKYGGWVSFVVVGAH